MRESKGVSLDVSVDDEMKFYDHQAMEKEEDKIRVSRNRNW